MRYTALILFIFLTACELRNPTAPYVLTITPRLVRNLDDTLISTSGLIYWKGDFWTHGDTYGGEIFSLDTLGKIKKQVAVNATWGNWEDMAQDKKYIYIANTGNNLNGARQDLCVYRIAKKDLLKNDTADVIVDTIKYSYENQKSLKQRKIDDTDFDCEAMISYGDSLYLFSKQWRKGGTTVYALPKKPGKYVALPRGFYNIDGLITGAAAMPSRGIVVLCGYRTNKATYINPFVLLLHSYKGTQFFSGQKRRFEIDAPYHQVEAITLTPDGRCFITNEGIDKFVVKIKPKLMELRLPRGTSHD